MASSREYESRSRAIIFSKSKKAQTHCFWEADTVSQLAAAGTFCNLILRASATMDENAWASSSGIPRVIHRVFRDRVHLKLAAAVTRQQVQATQPRWACRDHVASEMRLEHLDRVGQRSDAGLRYHLCVYELLLKEGGVVAHPNLLFLDRIEPFVRGHDVVLAEESPHLISAAFMAATPFHPLLWAIIRELPGQVRLYGSTGYGAGAPFLTRLVAERFPGLLVLPQRLLFQLFDTSDETPVLPPGALAVFAPDPEAMVNPESTFRQSPITLDRVRPQSGHAEMAKKQGRTHAGS